VQFPKQCCDSSLPDPRASLWQTWTEQENAEEGARWKFICSVGCPPHSKVSWAIVVLGGEPTEFMVLALAMLQIYPTPAFRWLFAVGLLSIWYALAEAHPVLHQHSRIGRPWQKHTRYAHSTQHPPHSALVEAQAEADPVLPWANLLLPRRTCSSASQGHQPIWSALDQGGRALPTRSCRDSCTWRCCSLWLGEHCH
jgi:hypothetical protein